MWANVHHHRPTQSRRLAGRVREGHARPYRAPTSRRRGPISFRLLVESVKDYADLHPRHRRTRRDLEPGRRTHQGIQGRRDHRQTLLDLLSTPRSRRAAGKTERELEIATSADGRFEEEGWRVRKDGSRMWANVTITALRNPDGTLFGFAKVTRDLTERRQAEEARRSLAVERAALAERARVQEFQERFIAILGHDLRNPLAAIDYGAGLLQRRATDPARCGETVDYRMRTSSVRMSRMIEQILDPLHARGSAVASNWKRTRLNIAEVLTPHHRRAARDASVRDTRSRLFRPGG